jgi:phenylacetate-coenzyme A ligase PaaK-like adenylate-forming protein
MFSNFTNRPLQSNAYADRPFSFLTPAALEDFANIAAIDLIENGQRAARENWQNKQLTNLLRHAHVRSNFWRQRMPSGPIGHGIIKNLPIQMRADVVKQVELEGCLATSDGTGPMAYASTGSTGTPVKVFYTPQNSYYNALRGLAQYFFNNLSLECNHVKIGPPSSLDVLEKGTIKVKSADVWAGVLSKIFRNGSSKSIIHLYNDDALIDELLKEGEIGYLACHSRIMEILLRKGGVDLIKKLGIKLWFHVSDYRDPETVNVLAEIGVACLSRYSAAEVGPIAYECQRVQGHYHIVHSNVIVEYDDQLTTTSNGVTVGRLLLTHLHSYATPIIRYDIGDFGQLEDRCPCGHDGPTLSNIYGRGKHFLRHPDGSLVPFYLSTRALLRVVPGFAECRVRQNELDTIDVELGGRNSISEEEKSNLTKLIVASTDPAFRLRIKTTDHIDWSGSPKRLLFSSALA